MISETNGHTVRSAFCLKLVRSVDIAWFRILFTHSCIWSVDLNMGLSSRCRMGLDERRTWELWRCAIKGVSKPYDDRVVDGDVDYRTQAVIVVHILGIECVFVCLIDLCRFATLELWENPRPVSCSILRGTPSLFITVRQNRKSACAGSTTVRPPSLKMRRMEKTYCQIPMTPTPPSAALTFIVLDFTKTSETAKPALFSRSS